jgi:hypothetical protein
MRSSWRWGGLVCLVDTLEEVGGRCFGHADVADADQRQQGGGFGDGYGDADFLSVDDADRSVVSAVGEVGARCGSGGGSVDDEASAAGVGAVLVDFVRRRRGLLLQRLMMLHRRVRPPHRILEGAEPRVPAARGQAPQGVRRPRRRGEGASQNRTAPRGGQLLDKRVKRRAERRLSRLLPDEFAQILAEEKRKARAETKKADRMRADVSPSTTPSSLQP